MSPNIQNDASPKTNSLPLPGNMPPMKTFPLRRAMGKNTHEKVHIGFLHCSLGIVPTVMSDPSLVLVMSIHAYAGRNAFAQISSPTSVFPGPPSCHWLRRRTWIGKTKVENKFLCYI